MSVPSFPSTRAEVDTFPALPWARGGRTLFLCPRPGCSGSSWCPEARDHVLVPVQPVKAGSMNVRGWQREREQRRMHNNGAPPLSGGGMNAP
jgi:hypothetical protein